MARGRTRLNAALTAFARASRLARAAPRDPLPSELVATVAIPGYENIRVWGDEVTPSFLASIETKDEEVRAAAEAGRSPKSALKADFLAISGGGDQGAFAAGVLSGWAKRGDRPDFEVVTGVSAGALAAPFAFIGPGCDKVLRDVYTKFGAPDLYRSRGVLGYFSDAFEDNAPMKRMIEGYATPRFLDQIAEGYRDGRRLFIMTTNLDAQRPVVWDLSAIAASGRADRSEMFTKVLLATSAIPGLFPPVYFPVVAGDGKLYSEMHVDGGVTAQLVFVPPEAKVIEIEDKVFKKRRGRDLWVIRNSKIAPEYRLDPPRALPIIARAVRTMVKYQVISDLARLYRFAESNNTRFHYCAVPSSHEMGDKKPFDKSLAAELFASGEVVGSKGMWISQPPHSPMLEKSFSGDVMPLAAAEAKARQVEPSGLERGL